MDPITHSLVGGVTAKSLKTSNRRFWIMMFLGEAPDLDVFCGSWGPWAYWLQHRGITHSFFGVAVQAVLFAWLFSKWDRGPFSQRLWHYAIPLFLHACCDYLTSYGVPLFSPFSLREVSGNIVPAVTLIPLVFMMIGLIVLHRGKNEGWRATRPIWAAWGVYLILSLGGRAYAGHIMGSVDGKMTVVPGLINPFRWSAVVQKDWCCSYEETSIYTLTGAKVKGRVVTADVESPPIRASLNSPLTRQFLESIRWPVARVSVNTEGGWHVDWGKIIFSSRGFVRGLWAVDVNKEGDVTSEKRAFEFWDVD